MSFEPTYCIGDMYATVEQEAFDTAGEPIILVRMVHPPSLVHAHLTSLRPMPSTTYTLSELHQQLNSLDKGGNIKLVHLVGDALELNNFEQLIASLWTWGYQILLNSYGSFPLPPETLTPIRSLYVIAKPGLLPTIRALKAAKEVRGYIKEPEDEFEQQLRWLHGPMHQYTAGKLFAMPFTLEQQCVDDTIQFCLSTGIRFQAPLCRVANLDVNFQGLHGKEVVDTFHAQDKYPLPYSGSNPDPYPRIMNSERENQIWESSIKKDFISNKVSEPKVETGYFNPLDQRFHPSTP